MPLEGIYSFGILLGLLGLLATGGVASLCIGRWSERGAVAAGAGGAIAACAAGLVLACVSLAKRLDLTLVLPWNMPYGEFRIGIDPLSAFFLVPIFLLSGLAAVYAVGYFRPWNGRHPGRFWFFYDLLVASMALVTTARNGVLFLAAWETMALASFFLVIHDEAGEETRRAGWIYLVASHAGTAFLLALFILLGPGGWGTGAAAAVPAGVAFSLALVGFGTKAGLFPMHVWLPEAHPAAPSPVSAIMSGVMIKTGIYGIARTLATLGAVPVWCAWLVLGLGAVTGVYGILFSLAQRDVKRALAYSSVENVGIIALGLGFGMLGVQAGRPSLAALGFAGALLHVLNHALFKGLLFLGAGAVVHATGTRMFEQLGGLLKRMPWTGAAFLVGSAAICGLPPFNGFAGEFLIFGGAFQAILGNGSLALAGVATVLALGLIGGLAVAGFARTFGVAFLGEPRSAAAECAHEAHAAMRWPLAILAALCLGIGLAAGSAVRLLAPAVDVLVAAGTGPSGVEALPGPASWLSPIAVGAGLLLAVAAMLAAIRRRLLAGRPRRESPTWDCGYAAPNPRMQYTAAGFAQPLTLGARSILRPRETRVPPQGIYPARAEFADETPDAAGRNLFEPLFSRTADLLARLRGLQQGRVHVYVLYVVATLVVLLAWALRT